VPSSTGAIQIASLVNVTALPRRNGAPSVNTPSGPVSATHGAADAPLKMPYVTVEPIDGSTTAIVASEVVTND
jgi:hypothetical protein